MLVSVHVPKTAGTSFRSVLESALPGKVRCDYGDNYKIEDPKGLSVPVASWRALNRLRQCRYFRQLALPGDVAVHGHFAASKYAENQENQIISWVRDPVERVISHYRYWQRERDPSHSVCRALHSERLSLEEFAQVPTMRNLQSRYLDVPIERFAFLGVSEHFDYEVRRFGDMFGFRTGEIPRCNGAGSPADVPDATRRLIRGLNEQDVRLYESVLERKAA